MKYLISIIAVIAVIVTTTSATNEQVFNTRQGDLAPYIELVEGDTSHRLNTADFSGQYLLISFWTSTDAPSRVSCNRYASWVTKHPNTLTHIGINFDENADLFSSVVKIDQLPVESQYNVQGTTAETIKKDYNISTGLGTVLIDREGRIAAVNPSAGQLEEILNN